MEQAERDKMDVTVPEACGQHLMCGLYYPRSWRYFDLAAWSDSQDAASLNEHDRVGDRRRVGRRIDLRANDCDVGGAACRWESEAAKRQAEPKSKEHKRQFQIVTSGFSHMN